ncbi:MAG TPA: SAM-dependent methyltransferase, partial [Alcanivorax sp.]|nr:SAM-dependent methyltransferase [Alcanivorax sp.]
MSLYEDKLFPVLLDWATRPVYRDRARIVGQAQGRVLELGVGTGSNFAFYGDSATEIHGIEPVEAMLDIAREAADQCPHPDRFVLRTGDAQQLPYPDHHFDTVVACLVFCTIPD